MGEFTNRKRRKGIIISNLVLLLLQTLLVSFAVTATSALISLIPLTGGEEGNGAKDNFPPMPWFHGVLITITSGVMCSLLREVD